MTIMAIEFFNEILEICQLKSDNQAPQNEGGNVKERKNLKKVVIAPKKVHYCDLTGVPLN